MITSKSNSVGWALIRIQFSVVGGRRIFNAQSRAVTWPLREMDGKHVPAGTSFQVISNSHCTHQPDLRSSGPMSEVIYPRSPRETMCGWMHLPRYIDKIRLHLLGRL